MKTSDSTNEPSESKQGGSEGNLCDKWSGLVYHLPAPTLKVVHGLSSAAVRSPKRTISITTSLAFALIILGILTNFTVDTDDDEVWTPQGSRAIKVSIFCFLFVQTTILLSYPLTAR